MSDSETPKTFGDVEPSKWPGERLGLPERGQMSVARVGRRSVAIIVDWFLAWVISLPFGQANQTGLVTLLVFALMQIVFIPTIGGSIGHRLLGMKLISLNGTWIGLYRPFIRTILLVLVIPVLVWDSDQRGFHDKIAATVLVVA